MSDSAVLSPPVSGLLERLGFAPDHPLVRSMSTPVLRGNNVVLGAPPAAGYAAPAIAAVIARNEAPNRTLVVVPRSALEIWSQPSAALAHASGRTAGSAATTGRAARHLTSGTDVLVTTIGVAADLLKHSALDPSSIGSLVLAWPELESSDDIWVPLFADLPKSAQRVFVTTDPAGVAALADRYAWRATSVGPLGSSSVEPVAGRIRVVSTSWEGRVAALGSVVEMLDLGRVTVWTADRWFHAAIAERLAGLGTEGSVVTERPGDGFVVFFDAPPPDLLTQAKPDQTVVLAPPDSEPYFRRVLARPTPLLLADLDQVRREIAEEREVIRSRVVAQSESGLDRASLTTLSPLFERFTPTSIAVALHGLWLQAKAAPPSEPTRPAPLMTPRAAPSRHSVWLSCGRKDGIAMGEVLALLTLDAAIPRDRLGKVDMKETFTLVELATEADARDAVERLAGRTIKNRRITARVDQGRPKGPAARGPRRERA